MKNNKNTSKQDSFSRRSTWGKVYKKTMDTGIYLPIIYSFFYLSAISLSNIGNDEKNAYMFFFWVGLTISFLAMAEIFRSNYKITYLKDKSSPPLPRQKIPVPQKKSSLDYPKLSYSGGKELKVDYSDRVDYYRFEDGKFCYCGSVKKNQQRQIR